MSFWEFANPRRFLALAERYWPTVMVLAVATLATGLIWAFFFTPDEATQGASVKIFYLHVPAAMMAINIWAMMLVASLVWYIRRHHVSALAAKAAAPIGITMTLIALITGALWGAPVWDTWWEWDPRLTSFLILFFFYLGYVALWQAIDDGETAADLTAILCMVGSIFAILSRYAVWFWGDQGLHQDASLSLDEAENVADVFWYPALVSIAGFVLLFVALVLMRTATEIRLRRTRALQLREARA